MIGHSLFGARVEFGEPLFVTISPSSRHSALTIRCSRYRASDLAVRHCTPATEQLPSWCGQFVPQLWHDDAGQHVAIDVPDYSPRRIMVGRETQENDMGMPRMRVSHVFYRRVQCKASDATQKRICVQ